MSRVTETIFLVQHELCEDKCRLNENLCNLKQKYDNVIWYSMLTMIC